MSKAVPYLEAFDKLRNELLPINFISLDSHELVLGSASSCTTLDHKKISLLIACLVCINQELYERIEP